MKKINLLRATIAVISSSSFDYEGPGTQLDEATPPGKAFADFLANQLVAGGATHLRGPVPGEEGWTFDLTLLGSSFRIFVHWAPIGRPPTDRWVIQPDICKGLLRAFLGRRTTDSEVAPLVMELRRVLDSSPEIQSVEWITPEEFKKV